MEIIKKMFWEGNLLTGSGTNNIGFFPVSCDWNLMQV